MLQTKMSKIVDLLLGDSEPKGQKRSVNFGAESGPLTKVAKLSEDSVQEKDGTNKDVQTIDVGQNNNIDSSTTSASSNKNKLENCATDTVLSTSGDVKKEEISSTSEKIPSEKNKITVLSTLNLPSFSDDIQADIPVAKNQRFVGTCMSCNNSLEGKAPLMLGCLHIYCSKCILQRQYFRLSSSMSKGTPQDGKNPSAVHTSFEKFSDINAIPDEAFDSLTNLKKYIVDNADAVSRLVVKCKVCECNTRARVISNNLFVTKANATDTCKDEHFPTVKVETLCTNCEENSIAVRFCKDCNEHLCEECVNAHKRVKITKEHTLDVLESAESDKGSTNRTKVARCDKHVNEEIKLFCETCNKLTCRDCQLEFHRDHKYLFVSEAAEGQAKILETMQSKLSEKKFFLDQTSNTIKTRLNTMMGCRNKANQDIIKFHEHLQERVTAKCQFFLDKIHEITSMRRTKLSNQLFATERLSSAVDHCVKFIDFAIEKQNSLALLDTKQMILEYVTTVMRQKFTTNPVASSDIVFVPDNNVVKAITMKLGSLLWGEPASSVINLKANHMQQPGKVRKSSPGQFLQSPAKSSPTTPPNVTSHYPAGAIHYRPHHKNTMPLSSSTQSRILPTVVQPHLATPLAPPIPVPFTSSSVEKTQGYFDSTGSTLPQNRYIPQNVPHGVQQPQTMHHHKRQLPTQQQLHQQHQCQQQQSFQQPQQQQQQQRLMRPSNSYGSRQIPTILQKTSVESRRPVNVINSTSLRRASGNGDNMAIPKVQVQHQTNDLRPFVTRGSSFPQDQSKEVVNIDLTQFKHQGTSHPMGPNNIRVLQRIPSHPPQAFIPSVPETLVSEQFRSSPMTQSMGEMTLQKQQSSAPDHPGQPSPIGFTKAPRNPTYMQEANADNPGSISSADSGFGGGVAKQNDSSVTNDEWPLNDMCHQKANDFSFSPPPLFDLTGIVKIDEEQETQADARGTAEISTIKEERKDDDFDVEKELSSLVEDEKREKKITVKAEQLLDSPPSKNIAAEKEVSQPEEDKNNLCHSNSSERKYDPNEDWCAVCNNGGDLLCCDTCPKVYHYHCHIPEITNAPPGTWQCTLCRDINKMLEAESKYPKRKRVGGLQGKELKLCEKLTLELCCSEHSVPFHQAVRASEVPDYYRVIKKPMDLSKVKKKLLLSNFAHYATVEEFLEDIQQLLTNCLHFNGEESPTGEMGKKLQKFFIKHVKEKFPERSDFMENWMKEQRQFLDDNPLVANALEERPQKVGIPHRKSSGDKTKLPYESDTLWQPTQDDEGEETESPGDVSERFSEDSCSDSDNSSGSRPGKRRKQSKSGIVHIK